ncbi:hypothetical protein C8Q74DRAFT_1297732 [Fomes fomentarius]|nr:hypothetical protein C8Q74DRAFT_1297732 [Fomes fomentarius]
MPVRVSLFRAMSIHVSFTGLLELIKLGSACDTYCYHRLTRTHRGLVIVGHRSLPVSHRPTLHTQVPEGDVYRTMSFHVILIMKLVLCLLLLIDQARPTSSFLVFPT